MIVNDLPGYYAHLTIPERPGSKQVYVMQSLDERRRHPLYVDDKKWIADIERIMRKRTSALVEHLTLEDEQMRKEFVFKVFAMLSCQLLYIFVNLLLFYSDEKYKHLFGKEIRVTYVFFAIAGGIYLALLLAKGLRKARLVNLILITVLVFFLALGLSAYGCVQPMNVFVYTAGIMFAAVVFVTVLSKFGPCDVAGCSMICCLLGVVICIYMVVLGLIYFLTKVRLLHLAYAGITVTILSVYILFDTQYMLDDESLNLSPKEFIRGNIHLYIDIVLLLFRFLKYIKQKGIKLLKRMKRKRKNINKT